MNSDANDNLIETRDGATSVISLNRPEHLNALDTRLMRRLTEFLEIVAVDETVRCVVITGSGRGFCAGGDLKEMRAAADARVSATPTTAAKNGESPFENRVRWLRRSTEAARLLHEMPKPTIAMVNGACAGAGLSLAGACDFRFAAQSAKFVSGFTAMGLPGDYGGSWFWSRILGAAKARQLYLLGEQMGAPRALDFGLIDGLFEDSALHTSVMAIARRLAALSPIGLSLAKANLNSALVESLSAALDREAENMMLAREAHLRMRKAAVDD